MQLVYLILRENTLFWNLLKAAFTNSKSWWNGYKGKYAKSN